LYPGIVLSLAIILAIGGAWFILPNLVSIFNESQGALPITTKVLLWFGNFLRDFGAIAVPTIIVAIFLMIFFVFFFRKTKFIGEKVLFIIPGINTLVKGVELGRFGYILGALLQAGFQANEALSSLLDGTEHHMYRKLYAHLQKSILHGDSFKSALASFPKSDNLIPLPIQQLIVSAEKSGRLPETLMKIGIIFEEKTEAMSQDLSSILEPIVLLIVGLIVGLVVSGIIGPIYGLSSQF
jgi:type IV pilus assembly protein PilC